MKKQGLIICILLVCLAALLPGCESAQQKRLNERVTLRHTDKIRYGTYVAYQNLQHIFPQAQIHINKESPSYASFSHEYVSYEVDTAVERERKDAEHTLYVIISPYFSPNLREYNALMRFVGRGNHVFISAQYWGQEFCDSLKMDVLPSFMDSLWATVKNPETYDSLAFTYPGQSIGGYFSKYDSLYADVLGKNDDGDANFIRHSYNDGGTLFNHASTLAFTNIILLHKNNYKY